MKCENCESEKAYKRMYLRGMFLCFPCYEVVLSKEDEGFENL